MKGVIKKIDFGGWETPDERTRRFMKIPPMKKMELLEELHQMVVKTSTKRMMKLRWELRENRSLGKYRSKEWK